MGNKHVYPSEGKKGTQYGTQYIYNEGITKRELFAAMLAQAMISHNGNGHKTWSQIASDSVRMADHLLNQLEKEEEK